MTGEVAGSGRMAAVMRLLAAGSVLSAGYGVWVAASVWAQVPVLALFAAAAAAGALAALAGAYQGRQGWVAGGALAQILAPTAFAWIASLIVAGAGAALLVVALRSRRRVSA